MQFKRLKTLILKSDRELIAICKNTKLNDTDTVARIKKTLISKGYTIMVSEEISLEKYL